MGTESQFYKMQSVSEMDGVLLVVHSNVTVLHANELYT